MSIDLVGSLDAINRSDASSRTESGESTPPRPEQDDDVAQLPFVPQRARLMPGGPRFISASPSTLTCRNFCSARTVAQFPGKPHPAASRLTRLFAARAIAPNFLGSHGRSGSGLQPTRMQRAPRSIPTSMLLKRLSSCLKRQCIDLGRPHVHSRMSTDHMLADSVVLLRRAALGGKSEFYGREIRPIPQPLTHRVGG